MNTSQKGIDLIKSFEGVRLKAYKPVQTEKYWTIGYGHYGADVAENMVITMDQAIEYLKKDIAKFEKAVNNLGFALTQNQFDALVSFAYNCGTGNLKKLCKDRTLAQIPDAMLNFNHSGKTVLPGLTRRRQAERALFFSDTVPEKVSVQATKDVRTLALEVLANKWGSGAQRRKALTNAGYDYCAVQKEVNAICKHTSTVSVQDIAREVIAGKWGIGGIRKDRLTKAGYNYSEVQAEVNRILKGK